MNIQPSELSALDGQHIFVDIRSCEDVAYGTMPGALALRPEEIPAALPLPEERLLILVGTRTAEREAEELCTLGYRAAALVGGYGAWLQNTLEHRDAGEVTHQVEESLRKRFRRSIFSKFTRAIREYELVQPGDCVAVCISGGKDSMLLAKLFQELKRHDKFPFEVKFIVMDPGYSRVNRRIIEENARLMGIPVQIFDSEIFDAVYTIEKSPCYLCARMRRGHLYAYAKSLGCNKIALGHHYDDVIGTILMGMLYGAQIQTMMPKLHSTNFEGMELIRPLYLVHEDDIIAWRDANDLHFLQCACRFTESVANDEHESRSKRKEIKNLIRSMKEVNPEVEAHIFRSVENVNLSTIIAYKKDGKTVHFLDHYNDIAPSED